MATLKLIAFVALAVASTDAARYTFQNGVDLSDASVWFGANPNPGSPTPKETKIGGGAGIAVKASSELQVGCKLSLGGASKISLGSSSGAMGKLVLSSSCDDSSAQSATLIPGSDIPTEALGVAGQQFDFNCHMNWMSNGANKYGLNPPCAGDDAVVKTDNTNPVMFVTTNDAPTKVNRLFVGNDQITSSDCTTENGVIIRDSAIVDLSMCGVGKTELGASTQSSCQSSCPPTIVLDDGTFVQKVVDDDGNELLKVVDPKKGIDDDRVASIGSDNEGNVIVTVDGDKYIQPDDPFKPASVKSTQATTSDAPTTDKDGNTPTKGKTTKDKGDKTTPTTTTEEATTEGGDTTDPSESKGSSAGDSSGNTLIIVIVIVVVVLLLAVIAAVVVLKKRGGDSTRSGGVVSFENPMYDDASGNNGGNAGAADNGGGYQDVGPASATGGYADVAANHEGFYDDAGDPYAEPAAGGGYMDVAPGEGGAGYMDVAPGDFEDDDEEEV